MIHTFSTQPRRTGLGLATLGLAALALTAAHPAAAQTTIYNFQVAGNAAGQYTGVGIAGNPGYTSSSFNRPTAVVSGTTSGSFQVGGTGFGTVVDSNNNPNTALTFNYQASGEQANGSYTQPEAGALLELFATGVGLKDISFTGLSPNANFSAIFYGENGNFQDGRVTRFALTDSSFTTVISAVATANSGNTFTTNPGNYVTLSGTTDNSGNIYATYVNANSATDQGVLNGAQFTVVSPAPEASQTVAMTVMLLGLGGLLLVARRRTAHS